METMADYTSVEWGVFWDACNDLRQVQDANEALDILEETPADDKGVYDVFLDDASGRLEIELSKHVQGTQHLRTVVAHCGQSEPGGPMHFSMVFICGDDLHVVVVPEEDTTWRVMPLPRSGDQRAAAAAAAEVNTVLREIVMPFGSQARFTLCPLASLALQQPVQDAMMHSLRLVPAV